MRFIGVMYRADGTAVDVSDATSVGTLLDVIESLSDDLNREKARHAGTLRLMAAQPPVRAER